MKRLSVILIPALLVVHIACADEKKPADKAPGEKAELSAVPYDEIRTFADIFSRIKKDYVEPVSDKDMMDNAIRGMLSGLDPHSSYLGKNEFQDLQEGTTGEFGGLGIEVGIENGFVKVIAPIDDTPADKAGVKAGDTIIRLDDKPVKGIGLDAAVRLMRGKPGDPIVLTIVRDGEEKPLKITIVRDIIKIESVKSRLLEPGYIYLRITQFQSHTAELLRKAIEKRTKESNGEVKGVVLDLRNNPGGVLNGAVSVSDTFLEEGVIVYTEGRTRDAASKYHAKPGDMINDAALVVLVNGGSASASEIVAGALQDHGRAIILGEKTFGKGSVQTILPMSNGEAIKLTTARYFTPSGRSIQALGIEPDIRTQALSLVRNGEPDIARVNEARLSGHLKNNDENEKPDRVKKQKESTLAESDYTLFEALNILKSLSILQKKKD